MKSFDNEEDAEAFGDKNYLIPVINKKETRNGTRYEVSEGYGA